MTNSLISLTLFLFISSCASYTIRKDFDEKYDFKKLKTFNILTSGGDGLNSDSLSGMRAIEALENELKLLGYEQIQSGVTDFSAILNYEKRVYVTPKSTSIGLGIGSSSRGSMGGVGLGLGTGRVEDLSVLKIKFIDGESKKEIWNSSASGEFEEKDPRETTKNFQTAIKEMLKKFP